MKMLNIKIKTGFVDNNKITIDGNEVKFKKDSYGNYTYAYSTEKDIVNIKIVNYLSINTKTWFITNFLFFLISFFGLFDQRHNKNCIVRNCEFNVKLNQDVSNFDINTFIGANKTGSATIKADTEYETVSNNIYVDEVAQKRYKTLKITKIYTTIAIILIALLIIFLVSK